MIKKISLFIAIVFLACIEVPAVITFVVNTISPELIIPFGFFSVFFWSLWQFYNCKKIKLLKLIIDLIASSYGMVSLWFLAQSIITAIAVKEYYYAHPFIFSISIVGLTTSTALKLSVSLIEALPEIKSQKMEPENKIAPDNEKLLSAPIQDTGVNLQGQLLPKKEPALVKK